jgi:hypothetical protein
MNTVEEMKRYGNVRLSHVDSLEYENPLECQTKYSENIKIILTRIKISSFFCVWIFYRINHVILLFSLYRVNNNSSEKFDDNVHS